MTKALPSDWFLRSRLKMRHILLLAAIDDQRSLHKAAAALHMTQPAATKLLGDLEATLDLRLFQRTVRGLTPTAHGNSLIRHARLMLGTLDHARAELSAISDGAAGKIAMGTLLVVAPVLVPQALALFKIGNPRVTVQVQEGTLAVLLPQLRRGEIDLIVGRLTSDFESEGLHFESCYDEPMCVVVGHHHPLAGTTGLKLADLAAESWILPSPETAYRQRIDAAFRQEGVEPPAQLVESVSILTNTMLLQETTMLGVMPFNVARHYVASGTVSVLDIELPPPSGPVGTITRAGPLTNPVLEPLLDAVRKVALRMAR
ncbi:MAG: LysR family transcriptional regulator [Betaproteobacteria bacterium]|jgi:DNA-binding transcriptional LysR family regulator|nr:LysR family transcriptional regulator [Betaproteobacteria bacterium]MBK7079461.1 LysR family transcriptional regulator [Betaproteobacteria bacterium]MBK7743120.1 LysR family transcriptional regulator [Betaproteobacteria bacterium]MBK8688302.1 LysR family transcriptional regulator [Betaproteobacteria bacterium]MBK9676799.1 LysR family transcriptional regulator [Betaproteobacteria bacterium]